jgi:citrate lyase subunit beta/citryl-CoA lyase
MMVNPLHKKHLQKIPTIDSGIITINLEDGIAPSKKAEALYNVIDFLQDDPKSPSKIVIRINELDLGGIDEIKKLQGIHFDAIRIPKIHSKNEVQSILDILDPRYELHLSCETKEAFSDISSLKTDSRVTTLYLGILDLFNDLGISHECLDLNNATVDYILAKFLVDCKSCGFFPVGFIYQEYQNTQEFTQWCKKLKVMGYDAMGSIGPKQSTIAKEVFGPTKAQIERAKQIVKAFEAKSQENIGGFMDERYGFIDEPIYKNAKLILTTFCS